ncbi:MAG TPA: sorbosone dehydrogenase family protein [Candidatus Binataceae bacterium]|nr:sorbosone dehydrogenase family protein [Candidatus Binataceae bacterium]
MARFLCPERVLILVSIACAAMVEVAPAGARAQNVLTGAQAFGDWRQDAPLVARRITVNALPAPGQTASAFNVARIVDRPPNSPLRLPPGFKVDRFAGGLDNPRQIHTAPNGDIFVAESRAGLIRVMRAASGATRPAINQVFASGLRLPFGMAFYPPGPHPRYLYVGDNDALVRFPYRNGDLRASAPMRKLASLPAGGVHWTRDVVVSADGSHLFVSVGSGSNDDINPGENESERADILIFNPDGSGKRIYASGIRNAVGLAIAPLTGALWCSTNERDGMGDDLPPDYITPVHAGGFYGWPWFYIGPHQDPNHVGQHPELASRVIVPLVLIQPHSASLGLAFYRARQFPAAYRGGIFAAEHGSWNRSKRTGYKVIFVPLSGGRPSGEYLDFMTGFVAPGGQVWGRPVGVTVAADGALLVSDDGSNSIWRISYQGSASE